jgi:hypothetical protein
MSDLTTVRRRLDHVQHLIETTEDHIDSSADSHALMRALGLLEQTFADLDELDEDSMNNS